MLLSFSLNKCNWDMIFAYFNSSPYRVKKNSDQKGKNSFLFIDLLDFSFGVACVVSLSNRGPARKLERGQKRIEWRGEGEKIFFFFLPFPLPFISLICSRPNFLDEPTRKRLLRRLLSGFCNYCCFSHLTDIVRQSWLHADAVRCPHSQFLSFNSEIWEKTKGAVSVVNKVLNNLKWQVIFFYNE